MAEKCSKNKILVSRGVHAVPEGEKTEPKGKEKAIISSFEKENKKKGLRVFVAGGSRSGNDPLYAEEAYKLGVKIAEMNFRLDFGLSSKGIMGAVAKGVLKVWADKKRKDVPIKGVTTKEYLVYCQQDEIIEHIHDVIVARTLEERKNQLLNADFVIFAPGGIGTLDELVYDCVAMQDGFLPLKPFVIFNVNSHYHHVLEYLKEIYIKGFSSAVPFIVVDDSVEAGVAFEVLKHKFKTEPPKDKMLESVERVMQVLPYLIEQKRISSKISIAKILDKIETGGDEALAEEIEKAYLRKEIERTYSRLERTGQDTAWVSEKLSGLKLRRKSTEGK